MRRLFIVWLSWASLAIIHVPAHALGKELVLGLPPYQPSRMLIAEYQPLADHLRTALKRPVRIVTAKDTHTYTQRMLAGDYELVAVPGHLARLAQQDKDWYPLARFAPDTQVLLLARKQDMNLMPDDLKGRTLAMPDRLRLVSVAAEHWLAQRNLLADRDYTALETPSFGNAIDALLTRRADMAVISRAGTRQIREADLQQVRILAETASIPMHLFAVRADVAPDARAQIRRALVSYHPDEGIPIVDITPNVMNAMDIYLEETRRRLQGKVQPLQQAKP